jgi:hypothetical protein
MTQVLGLMQSTFDWQGNAHLPYCRLQRCVPHPTSFWQVRATGPGTAIVADADGAGGGTGAGAGGGGAGWGAGGACGYWAYVGAG